MSKPYTLYAWPLSYYSGKTRAYLRYKAIPHVEKPVRAWTLRTIRQRTGATVMPVVVTPQGEWLQDTSDIMDRLEQRFGDAPVVPDSPRQRLAAYLLEAWGDEFWLPPAMHYRWSFDENFTTLFQREGGDHLLPLAPRWLKNRMIGVGAAQMRGFLPGLGVTPEQLPAIEAWTHQMLDLLEAHFATLPYLLGTRPSYGDFGLIGPLFAHLGRDPYPKRVLIEPRPHLKAWIARMQEPKTPRGGEFLADDWVPATLAPIFKSIFAEFWPFLRATQQQVTQALPTLEPGRGFRRSMQPVTIPYARGTLTRSATPFSLWMAQRALDVYAAFDRSARSSVDGWLLSVGGGEAMQFKIAPPLKRLALHVAPE
jgi:glutathione S-transferase